MTTTSIDATLLSRKGKYGLFIHNAALSQALARVLHSHRGWQGLEVDQKEALEMIMHKVSRLMNGDPDYGDNWHDIAGYATLVEKRLLGQEI